LRDAVADGADPAVAAEILERLAEELRTPYEKESQLSSVIFRSEDAKEGPRAFAEKRPPVWRSR
jgi:enoyl-CoA hydratase